MEVSWTAAPGRLRALFEGDMARARGVMERDREVDSFDTLIDRQCMDFFA